MASGQDERMTLAPTRDLALFIESDKLLRKPKSSAQRRRFPVEEAAFKDAALQQVADQGFALLREPVAVHVHVHAPARGNQPQLPPVVKAYLDALEGIAYEDDRQVEHLLVRQDALQHPMMDGFEPEDGDFGKAAVFIQIEPVEAYRDRFDRAVRTTFWRRGPSPWKRAWTMRKEFKLQRLRSQLNASPAGSKEASELLLREMEEERLTDGVLADIDRPGPPAPGSRFVHERFPTHRLIWDVRRKSGAAFLLPPSGQGPGSSEPWLKSLKDKLDDFAAANVGLPFGGFVALDIAVRGASLHGKDLDNLAHAILEPFEEALCVRRGTVVGFRAYTATGEPKGVQVRVIDHTRLLSLDVVLGEMDTRVSFAERIQNWLELAARSHD